MNENREEEADAICDALTGADRGAYATALATLHRQPDMLAPVKPRILQALTEATGPRRFDLAFALAALGSRDPAVWDDLARSSAPLSPLDALEPFLQSANVDRVCLTAESPLVGEIVIDATGAPFLAPEEEDRGGGMGSIRLLAWSHDASGRRRGDVVQITGFFKAGVGLVVDAARSAGSDRH